MFTLTSLHKKISRYTSKTNNLLKEQSMIAAEDHSSLLNMNTRPEESDYFVQIWRWQHLIQ